MTEQEFKTSFSRLIGVFSDKSYPSERIKRIYELTGELPAKAMETIVNSMIDNFKYAPTPNDFREAVIGWKKTNRWHPQSAVHQTPYSVTCGKCNDFGILRIQTLVPPHSESLMRCDCDEGNMFGCAVPQWDSSLGAIYDRSPCPLEWYKPQMHQAENDQSVFLKIEQIVARWKQKQRDAEKHWRDLGYIKG